MSLTPPVVIPSDRAWLDPTLVARNLYVQTSVVDLDTLVPIPLAGLNVLRWAIGFIPGPAATEGCRVAPWGDSLGTSGVLMTPGVLLWYTLPLYGPLATGEWWGWGMPGTQVRVVQVIRNVFGR